MTDGQRPESGEKPAPPIQAEAVTRPGKRKRLTLIAVGAVVLLVGAGAVLVLSRGKTSGAKPVAAPGTLAAIRATAKSGTRPFTLAITLTPALASYFGGPKISGNGIADFGSDKAQWTLLVPEQMGKTIAVFADRGTTFVDVGATGHWVSLRSAADYRGYDQVPLVRDLVVLSNPFRELNLAESTRAAPQPKHLSLGSFHGQGFAPGMAPAAYIRPLAAPTTSVDCNNGSGASTQGGQSAQGTPDTKVLTTDFGLTSETDAETMQTVSSWPKPTTTMDSVDSGLCSIDTSMEQSSNGYDIKMVFNNPVPASTITTPKFTVQQTYSYTQVTHYAVPCSQGTWHGTSQHTMQGFVRDLGLAGVTETDPTGGGDLTLSIGASKAKLTSAETFTAEEKQFLTVPGSRGVPVTTATTHPVTYQRNVNVDGLAEGFPTDPNASAPNTPTSVVMNLTLGGDVELAETGSFIGPLAATRPALYGLQATIDCTTHKLTLTSKAFGDVTLNPISLALPTVQSTSLSQNWRTQFLTQPSTPSPTTSSSAAVTPPVVAAGVGISQSSWDAHHQVDPTVSSYYDPLPGAFPGASNQDRFNGVTFYHGKLNVYTEKLSPTANAATIDVTMAHDLGSGTTVVVPFQNLGRCGAAYYRNPAAVDSALDPTGLIQVLFYSDYAGLGTALDPSTIKSASVSGWPGAAPKTPLPATTCP